MTVSKGLPVGTRVRVRGYVWSGRQGIVIGRYGGVFNSHVILIAGEKHQVRGSDLIEDRLQTPYGFGPPAAVAPTPVASKTFRNSAWSAVRRWAGKTPSRGVIWVVGKSVGAR